MTTDLLRAHTDLASLTAWLETSGQRHAMIIEDHEVGGSPPLHRWLQDLNTTAQYDVVALGVDPNSSMILERRLLGALYLIFHPDGQEYVSTCSLADLREHVHGSLREGDEDRTRLFVLDRVNWGEHGFRHNLPCLLSDLSADCKVVVSIRADIGGTVNVQEWCSFLCWRAETTFCLRLSARADTTPPAERVAAWIEACSTVSEHVEPSVIDVLDVFAAAQRPLRLEELAEILGQGVDVVHDILPFVPAGILTVDRELRYIFDDPCASRDWVAIRHEASARVTERLIALGEQALRSQKSTVSPYVVEHLGALLAERGDFGAQISLVSEAWFNACSWQGNLLGLEADVEKVWQATRRCLLTSTTSSEEQRSPVLIAWFQCLHVSSSAMSSVRALGGTAGARGQMLAHLAGGFGAPERSRIWERAADALLTAELSITESDLLVQLAQEIQGQLRQAIREKVIATYRDDVERGGSSVWFLRALPLLDPSERRTLGDEIVSRLPRLSHEDAWIVHDSLTRAGSELAPKLLEALPGLPLSDGIRLRCALAPFLGEDVQQRVVTEVLDCFLLAPSSLGRPDLQFIAPLLCSEQLVRVGQALERPEQRERMLAVCIRALCKLGQAGDAEELVGSDITGIPFDWLLALAAGLPERRPALDTEVAARLLAMDTVRLGWTIERDVAELVRVVGVEPLLRLVRAIPDGLERLVARVALVPFAADADKGALITEAVEVFRAGTPEEKSYWRELLSCWKWMSASDTLLMLCRGARTIDALSSFVDLAPLLCMLGGDQLPSKVAEKLIEVGEWAP